MRRAEKMLGPIANSIKCKIEAGLNVCALEVINESYKHSVPEGSESHFKVFVVSSDFHEKTPIQRHRMVNNLLKDELSNGVHALSIQALTIDQWEANRTISGTPPCLGGMKKPVD